MINQLIQTYKGKRVFITGHTGFKGAWLLKILSMQGAYIKGYALEPKTESDFFNLIKGDELCDSVIADLRDKEILAQEIVSFQPDFIFHLAAQPLVRLSYQQPLETFDINIMGTAHLLDAVRQLNKQCQIVLITTDKVYYNNEWIYPYRENDRLGGYDPYSASKACAELIIESYRNSFFNLKEYSDHKKAIAVARAGNVIGGGDWSDDRLIPDIVRALDSSKKIVVRNPSAVRPWQHVLEPLFGYLQLAKAVEESPDKFSEPFNFGPLANDSMMVSEMVLMAINYWGEGESENAQAIVKQPHEAGLLKLDISKAVTELKWEPKFDAEKAVRFTMDWYREFYSDCSNIIAFTEKQIHLYTS